MSKENKVYCKVYGRYALFSEPVTRAGGEKNSYQIPTYEALCGVMRSIYWKPTFKWYIDRIRVINPISTESKGVRPIAYRSSANSLSKYNYLKNPCYIIEAHFEWDERHPELKDDRNEQKHMDIARRSIEKGGRRDVFLGCRECQGYVEPCNFFDEKGFYDDSGEIGFGFMFHGFNYFDNNPSRPLELRFWNAVMKDGIVEFPHPSECKPEYIKVTKTYTTSKVFGDHVGKDDKEGE